jgi:3-deoxy-D-manno-octulosonic acid kinase
MTPPALQQKIRESNPLQCGYIECRVSGSRIVVLDWAKSAVMKALEVGTLHEWASSQTVRKEMRGRGIIYSVHLPGESGTEVVVRRNRHGGLFQGVTGEYFLAPTRAPLELATALRLAAAGIPTPEVIAYAIYPALGIFARSDVMTRRLPAGADAPEAWKNADTSDREAMLRAISILLKKLVNAGAWHADLNLKNIYIAGNGVETTAYLLDVDRVTFPGETDVADRNFKRLARSVRKWSSRRGLDFDEESLARLAVLAEVNK